MSPRVAQTPAIQFTKDELRLIERAANLVIREWLNGHRGTTPASLAHRVVQKVARVLHPETGRGAA